MSFLTPAQVAELFQVSENWVLQRLARGDSVLSEHIKIRRDLDPSSDVPRQRDRRPTRIALRTVAEFAARNARQHGNAPFPEAITEEEIDSRMRDIARWLESRRRNQLFQRFLKYVRSVLEEEGIGGPTLQRVFNRLESFFDF